LRRFSGLPKISYRGWRSYSAIGISGISTIASNGVAGVKPNSIDINSDGVGVILNIKRLNFNYLKFIEESF